MSNKDKTQNAYKSSKNFYDDILTQNSFFGRMYMKIFWSGVDDNLIAKEVLSYIPDTFEGKILDCPVGTAVFTHEKWTKLQNADITCLDYSQDMLDNAKARLEKFSHITCLQGDVGNLQFEDENFDIVLSMNGFHAFPDKIKAYKEIARVLKKDGVFISCFYIKGKSKITDWLVSSILAKKGWFTPPFQTYEEVESILNSLYSNVQIHLKGSMIYFVAKNKI